MSTITIPTSVTSGTMSTTVSPLHNDDIPFWFKHLLPVFIIVIGAVGNSLAIAVLSKKRYRRISTCYYMLALAYFDNFLMVLFLVRWLNRLPGSPIAHNTAFCIGYFFSIRMGFCMAAWTLVLITFDRFVSIRFPLRSRSWCTVDRARLSLFLVAIIHVIGHLPYFWRYADEKATTFAGRCPYDLSHEFVRAFTVTRMVLLDRLVPWLAVLTFTVGLTFELCRNTDKESEDELGIVSKDKAIPKRVTAMSLIAAWAFFVLTFPTSVYEGLITFSKEAHVSVSDWLYELFVYLLYFNSAINFYLYLGVAKKFRADVKLMLSCKKKEPKMEGLGVNSSSVKL